MSYRVRTGWIAVALAATVWRGRHRRNGSTGAALADPGQRGAAEHHPFAVTPVGESKTVEVPIRTVVQAVAQDIATFKSALSASTVEVDDGETFSSGQESVPSSRSPGRLQRQGAHQRPDSDG
jgi:hypothetical protein